MSITNRVQVTEMVMMAKIKKGLSWTKIAKAVGQSKEWTTAALLGQMYGAVIQAGVFVAEDIATAEAAKVIENTQRDLNIALMNELALIFNRIGIDTGAVLGGMLTCAVLEGDDVRFLQS